MALFLASLYKRKTLASCCMAGNLLASHVIQHKGCGLKEHHSAYLRINQGTITPQLKIILADLKSSRYRKLIKQRTFFLF